jgi:hypothetical protein
VELMKILGEAVNTQLILPRSTLATTVRVVCPQNQKQAVDRLTPFRLFDHLTFVHYLVLQDNLD